MREAELKRIRSNFLLRKEGNCEAYVEFVGTSYLVYFLEGDTVSQIATNITREVFEVFWNSTIKSR